MNVDNFFYGAQAIFSSLIDSLRIITAYPLFIGFLFGFCVASVVHALLAADHIKHMPSMLWQDTSVSFKKVFPASVDGSYQHSYVDYVRNVSRMKSVFYMAGILLTILLILISLAFK